MSTSTEAPATDESVSADSADSADPADSADSAPMEEVEAAPGAFLGRIYRISAPSFGDRVYVGSTEDPERAPAEAPAKPPAMGARYVPLRVILWVGRRPGR